MSGITGDKSRFNRLRKQKLLRRKRAQERKQAAAATKSGAVQAETPTSRG